MKIQINSVNAEQTLITEKMIRSYVGKETVSRMSNHQYIELFNDLAGHLFETAALPNEEVTVNSDISSISYDMEFKDFIVKYY